MRRKYYLHKRNGIYYAELIDPETGMKLSARSTGEQNKEDALLVVSDWLKNGMPAFTPTGKRKIQEVITGKKILNSIKTAEITPAEAEKIVKELTKRHLITGTFVKSSSTEAELFSDFIIRLWSWDSPFIHEKIAYNHKISKRHSKDMIDLFNRHWHEVFKDLTVSEIKRDALKNHLMLMKDNGFAVSTLNQTLNVIAAPMAWAFREGLIPQNPAAGIKRFSGKGEKRDILTTSEINALTDLKWRDEHGRLAFLVALTCGLRLGEVTALQLKDIGDDRLYVRHSWARIDGLKSPKNGEERETPLLPWLRDALRKLGTSNPWENGDNAFIFFSPVKNTPIDRKALSDRFNFALNQIGIDEQTRKKRHLVFHSLRHNFTKALSSQIDQQTAMRVTGHKTSEIFSHYADHKTEEEFNNLLIASNNLWDEILIKKDVNHIQ